MKLDLLKLGCMAAATLAVVATTQAQLVSGYTENNDELLLGFTTSTSTGDVIIDLGTATQVGVGGSTVVDLIAHNNVGQSAVALLSQLNTQFTSMNSLQWGVVGGQLSTQHIYSTVAHGAAAPPVPGAAGQSIGAINTAGLSLANVGGGVTANQAIVDPSQGYGDSWNECIAPGTVGRNFSLTYHNPNTTNSSTFSTGGTKYQMADLYYSSASASTPVYKGFFTLGNDGSFTFTPATSTPPPAPTLSITRSGNTSSIYLATSSGATYSLYYTNTAGLVSPTTNWTLYGSTISGNGAVNHFTDTTTDSNRVYRVIAR